MTCECGTIYNVYFHLGGGKKNAKLMTIVMAGGPLSFGKRQSIKYHDGRIEFCFQVPSCLLLWQELI